MYEKIKSYINRYSWIWYLIMAGVACAICWIIYGGSADNTSAIDNLGRAKEQQRESLDINKDVKASIERSTQLNRQASERIDKAQEYQQRASDRIKEGASRLEEAAAILERNEQLIRDVEQRYQAQQGDGRAIKPPTEHMGAD